MFLHLLTELFCKDLSLLVRINCINPVHKNVSTYQNFKTCKDKRQPSTLWQACNSSIVCNEMLHHNTPSYSKHIKNPCAYCILENRTQLVMQSSTLLTYSGKIHFCYRCALQNYTILFAPYYSKEHQRADQRQCDVQLLSSDAYLPQKCASKLHYSLWQILQKKIRVLMNFICRILYNYCTEILTGSSL